MWQSIFDQKIYQSNEKSFLNVSCILKFYVLLLLLNPISGIYYSSIEGTFRRDTIMMIF